MKANLDAEISTTRFVNIDKDVFTIYIGGRVARELAALEEAVVPLFVAQVGAKHLVDRILQNQGVQDTNTDTPARKSLFAQILPEWAEEIKVKPLSEEEFRKDVQSKLAEQEKNVAALGGTVKDRDKEIEELKKEVEKLSKAASKETKVKKA